ncbi:hypothetical protein C8R46DRAFT_1289355 [Mycena filopes]|nr:hypothetical protein C8R46DRAFT_1289355 [Mycena filopes]
MHPPASGAPLGGGSNSKDRAQYLQRLHDLLLTTPFSDGQPASEFPLLKQFRGAWIYEGIISPETMQEKTIAGKLTSHLPLLVHTLMDCYIRAGRCADIGQPNSQTVSGSRLRIDQTILEVRPEFGNWQPDRSEQLDDVQARGPEYGTGGGVEATRVTGDGAQPQGQPGSAPAALLKGSDRRVHHPSSGRTRVRPKEAQDRSNTTPQEVYGQVCYEWSGRAGGVGICPETGGSDCSTGRVKQRL